MQAPAATAPPAAPQESALPAAGRIPASLSLDITGSPLAEPAFLDETIRAALDREIRPTLRAGSSLAYGPIVPWPLVPLVAGTRAAVSVTVTIAGNAASAPVSGATTVVLNSAPTAHADPDVLFLSDDPEYLPSEGIVSRGDIATGRSARLYYYHSDIGLPRDLDVVLTAPVASRVHLIDSAAGPDLDVMSVGHAVSRDYLAYHQSNEGTIVDVLPGRPFVVRHALLLPGEVVAGVADMTVVAGGPVATSVIATPAGGSPDAYLAGPRVSFDGHHRHGAFDLASYGSTQSTYSVGAPPPVVRYGGRIPTVANLDPHDDGRDFGDYGVARRMTFALQNPTDASELVYFYEKPLGGPVRSTFVIDGRLKEVGCARLSQPYGVMTYSLPPHSSGASTVLTMTDGGSFYPLEFGITATAPLPITPAVGAPDGCSPVAVPAT
ncbi:MAG: hypothetical protein NVS2B3_11620 [Vulcanimicrobiaceae bacterium]